MEVEFKLHNGGIDMTPYWNGPIPYFGAIIGNQDLGAGLLPYYQETVTFTVEENAPVPAVVYLKFPSTQSTAIQFGKETGYDYIPFMVDPYCKVTINFTGDFKNMVEMYENTTKQLLYFPRIIYKVDMEEAK